MRLSNKAHHEIHMKIQADADLQQEIKRQKKEKMLVTGEPLREDYVNRREYLGAVSRWRRSR